MALKKVLEAASSQKSSIDYWLKKIESVGFSERLSIDEFKAVFQKLNISKNFFVITITGTNGKGSTCHLLNNILLQSGFNVGLFTSPHIFKFNERIKINNTLISDFNCVKYFKEIEAIEKDFPIKFGYFTHAFLMACLAFRDQRLDFAIFEVGCGGRLDPTNTFDADMVAITSIGLDHQALLGDTRELIALEKSGLARKNHPMIIGESDFPNKAIEYMNQVKAQIINVSQNEHKHLNQIKPSFLHQNNLSVVIETLNQLKKRNYIIKNKVIENCVKNFKLNGRCQLFKFVKNDIERTVIFDVGHNEQSFQYLGEFLNQKFGKNQNYLILYSALMGKNTNDIFAQCTKLNMTWYLTSLEAVDYRAKSLEEISQSCQKFNNKLLIEANPEIAFDKMLNSNTDDILVVCGSFILVSKILSYAKDQGYIDDSMLF